MRVDGDCIGGGLFGIEGGEEDLDEFDKID